MDNKVLSQKSFESSIHAVTLRFKDAGLENSYITARSGMKLLTINAKRFLLAILVAHFVIHLIDILGTLGTSSNYTFSLEVWIVYSFLLVIILAEAVFYCVPTLIWFRGVAITVIGCFVLFHNDFANFQEKLFYPFIGTEYVLIRNL